MMTATTPQRRSDRNQTCLVNAIADVRRLLETRADGAPTAPPPADDDTGAALPRLVTAFGLTPFERLVMIACAAIELDGTFAELVARAHGDPARTAPTFALALALFPNAHWSALSPGRPLRSWRIIELASGGLPLANTPLQIDERIAHALTGIDSFDGRCDRLLTWLPPAPLVPSHELLAEQIAAALGLGGRDGPLIEVCGADAITRRAIAARAAAHAALGALALDADRLAHDGGDALLRLCVRETMIVPALLYVDCENGAPLGAAERAAAPIVIGTARPTAPGSREIVRIDIERPTPGEQRSIWTAALAPLAEREALAAELAATFDLTEAGIASAALGARAQWSLGTPPRRALWSAVNSKTRLRLEDLAERIIPRADWQTLVLPEAIGARLHTIVAHLQHRRKVLDEWGFAPPGSRGRGIAVLFAGSSGTGKTTAAEAIANALQFDLFRVDLAGIVNKYIGETEKNLRRLFAAAESGGCVLFFDEADALFGKRGEVKDSHDRYANIEIDYLLQRIESFPGIAILATNLKGSLDPAFTRRMRFIITFPFPDAGLRATIWERVIPAATPREALEPHALARWELSGGSIRNVALHGAFLAAERGEPLRMTHLREAARAEFAKLERPFLEAPA